MQVNGVNHINLVTGDLDATIAFYEGLLEMKAQQIPVAPAGFSGRWICDAQGNAIIHVQGYNPERHGELKTGLNGALDHVALTCVGFDATKARCEELGIEYRVNDRQFGDLRQVFVTDPNGISLELNYPGD
jgi:catechol 2,3-dioxygenase-like lactoylglutathione lyase family enzyme